MKNLTILAINALAVTAGVAETASTDSAIDATANTITLTTTSFNTGDEVAVSIDSGTLPAPLTAGIYYAIKINANTIKLAYSHSQAIALIPIDLTDTGTSGKVVTVKGAGIKSPSVDVKGIVDVSIQVAFNYSLAASDAAGTVSIEKSNDGINFIPEYGSTQSFSKASDMVAWDLKIYSNYVRISTVCTSGGSSTLETALVVLKEQGRGN